MARCALQAHLGRQGSGLAHLATTYHVVTRIPIREATGCQVLSAIGATQWSMLRWARAAQRHAALSATTCFGRSLDTRCPLSRVSGPLPDHVATSLAGACGACHRLPLRPYSCLAAVRRGPTT